MAKEKYNEILKKYDGNKDKAFTQYASEEGPDLWEEREDMGLTEDEMEEFKEILDNIFTNSVKK